MRGIQIRRIAVLCVGFVVLALVRPVHAQQADFESRWQNASLAIVLATAPIFQQPSVSDEPLRVAKEGSALRALEQIGEWWTVEFQDPLFGRRIGYIQNQFVRVTSSPAATDGVGHLDPIDLSLPKSGIDTRKDSASSQPSIPPVAANQPDHVGMPTKYKVWGSVLAGLGTYYFVSYAVTQPDDYVCVFDSCTSTNTYRTAWLTMGTALTSASALVFISGAKAGHSTSPSIALGPGAIMVRESVDLHRVWPWHRR